MFIPIGDHPNPRGTPYITYGLITINILVFLAITLPLSASGINTNDPQLIEYLRNLSQQTGVDPRMLLNHLSSYDLFLFHYGFRPAQPSMFALFSSMFLHSGWMHLIGNMLFLWIFGDNVEFQLGRFRYLMAYLASGIAATLFFTIFQLDSNTPMIGASGAISGVLGCYFLWFPRNRVKVLMVFFWFIDVWHIPARWVLGFYIVIENILPFLFSSGGSVAYGAHIGGFLGGLAIAWASERYSRKSLGNATDQNSYQRTSHIQGSLAHDFSHAVAKNDFDRAMVITSHFKPSDFRSIAIPDALKLSSWLANNGAPDLALNLHKRLLAFQPMAKEIAQVHLQIGLLYLHYFNRPTSAYQHLLTVLDLRPELAIEQQARSALSHIENIVKQQRNRGWLN